MDALSQERSLKKKLQNFLQDYQCLGTLRGFKHFQCYVRSKEELLISVNNTLQGNSLRYTDHKPTTCRKTLCPDDSLSSSCLPYDKGSLVLSHNTQVGLSGMKDRGVGLPPASPSQQEYLQVEDVTLFLIAGYARYSCPYVWVRSNHERLLKASGGIETDRDSPLKLKSTERWKTEDIKVTDVIAEVVRLCTYPAPLNPFEVDLQYFQSLFHPHDLICSAAMVACLQKIVLHIPDSKLYSVKVFEDLYYISKFHFTCLNKVVTTANIPILQENSRQQQQMTYQNKQPEKCQQQVKYQQNKQYSDQPQRHSIQSRYPRTPFPAQPSGSSANPTSYRGMIYGQGYDGTSPGGFNRMPAPTLL